MPTEHAPHGAARPLDGVLVADFSRVLAGPLPDDPRFARNPDRVRHRDALAAALEARLAVDTPAGWTERLTTASVPCGPVNDLAEALALAERLGLDPVVPVGPGPVPRIRSPLRLSATPVVEPTAPPRLDEHGAGLRTWLSGPPDRPLPSPTSPLSSSSSGAEA